jgi:thiol-disulfide isomerase/thioredoxin
VRKLLLAAFSLLMFVSASFGQEKLAPAIRKAPELAFTIPGQGQKLLSQYRGKVVALELIFTTCPHCQAASHIMGRLQNELGSRGFQAVDVAFNDNADLLVDGFIKDQQTQFPVGWTTRDQVLSFLGLSAVERFVVPQLILIDREGMIHYQTPPLGDEKSYQEATIRNRLEMLLNAGGGRKQVTGTHRTMASSRH